GRLQARSATAAAYATGGSWVSPLVAAGNADRRKAWREVAAYFAWPEVRGNAGSADLVTISLDYSIDAGASFVPVATASVGVGQSQQLEHEFVVPPVSRLLQLRVRWDSVADWAPVLTRLVVDYAVLDDGPRRRRWELKVVARDRTARRDGGVLAASGRAQIDALWSAWREQATVSFRDVDYDTTPVERTVRVLDVAEAAPKASDGGRWGDGVVTLRLGEV
ncbi:MAG: hypothetical protein M3509_13905, partial [Chloroflexota bacterium]|nr:hypothetical protein [Chloroflexota bacterium]